MTRLIGLIVVLILIAVVAFTLWMIERSPFIDDDGRIIKEKETDDGSDGPSKF